jgi:hypothetical protein
MRHTRQARPLERFEPLPGRIETVIEIAITTAIVGIVTVTAIGTGNIHIMDGSIHTEDIPKLFGREDGTRSIRTVGTRNIHMADIPNILTAATHMDMAEAGMVIAAF